MRLQPYGLSVRRGASVRVGGLRGRPRPHPLAAALEIVAATKASQPPTLSSGDTGNTCVIPAASTAPGDVLISVIQFVEGAAAITSPNGWTILESIGFDRFRVETRTVQAGDPSSWTWTYSQASHSRSGCMIAVRNGSIGNTSLAEPSPDPFTFPDVTALSDGALFIGFAGATDDHSSESYIANGALSIETQHVARGNRSYQVARSTAIFSEEGVSAGTISGRNFSNAQASNANIVSLVVEP